MTLRHWITLSLTFGLLLTINPGVSTADGGPPLPEGLGSEAKNGSAEPSLPEGLFDAVETSEPSLPEGLAEDTTGELYLLSGFLPRGHRFPLRSGS